MPPSPYDENEERERGYQRLRDEQDAREKRELYLVYLTGQALAGFAAADVSNVLEYDPETLREHQDAVGGLCVGYARSALRALQASEA